MELEKHIFKSIFIAKSVLEIIFFFKIKRLKTVRPTSGIRNYFMLEGHIKLDGDLIRQD
jgi:hypothetical protein